jgi:hypothetical protein
VDFGAMLLVGCDSGVEYPIRLEASPGVPQVLCYAEHLVFFKRKYNGLFI